MTGAEASYSNSDKQEFPRKQAEALAAELRASISGEVRFDDGTRALDGDR